MRQRCSCQGRESSGWDCWHVFESSTQQTKFDLAPSILIQVHHQILSIFLASLLAVLRRFRGSFSCTSGPYLHAISNMNEIKEKNRMYLCTLCVRALQRRLERKSSQVLETCPDPRAILAVASICWLPASRSALKYSLFECEIRLVCYSFFPIVI